MGAVDGGPPATGLLQQWCVLSFLVVPLVLCAAVLLVSGVAKLREPQATRDAFLALRLPRALADSPAPALLPWGELALGVLLLVGTGWLLLLATAATLLLFVGYLLVIARALGFDEKVSCNCFGKLGEQGVTRRTLVRNAVLVATGVLAVAAAVLHVSVPATLLDAPGTSLGWLVMAALTGALALLVLGHGPATASATTSLREGSRLPWVTFLDVATGAPLRVPETPDEKTVLLFVSLGCGSCVRVLEDLDDLRAAHPGATIRPVLSDTWAGDPATWEPAAARTDALLDPHGNISQFLVEWTPTAVLVDAQGVLLADPAVGEADVRALIASTSGPPATEPVVETQPDPEPEPRRPVEEPDDDEFSYERTTIPQAVVVDADGQPRTLHELTSRTAALLVSINCLCGTSREAAASVERWREQLPQLEVRLLSSMKPETLPEGLRPEGAVAYDHAGLTQKALALHGSPSAVLLGADGLLAGGPVEGAEAIEQFVADIAEQLAEAAPAE